MPPVGRFAPSPTGPMHLGSLVAAVASFVDIKAQGGLWRLRIDDVDSKRVIKGCAADIRNTLIRFGLRWDGDVVYQSEREAAYLDGLAELQARHLAFDCGCTRREARTGPAGIEGPIYPGTCRAGLPAGRVPRSIRFAVADIEIGFRDGVQGCVSQELARDIGDFVIRRSDGIVAYQLATVIDDAAQGVTRVVRGADLLSSTPRQMYLQRCLGLSEPTYAHTPLLVTREHDKLCKSSGARPLDPARPGPQLRQCLQYLGQKPPLSLDSCSPNTILEWAVDNWALNAVPKGPVVINPDWSDKC